MFIIKCTFSAQDNTGGRRFMLVACNLRETNYSSHKKDQTGIEVDNKNTTLDATAIGYYADKQKDLKCPLQSV